MIKELTGLTYHSVCDQLASMDPSLGSIIKTYGYPPLWTRPNVFETLVHIILEQQVSLSSALSALNKLKDKLQMITPEGILTLTDAQLKECYLSRQKTVYIKNLANSISNGETDLERFKFMENEHIRRELTALKGIGDWTVDVYLMFVLHRADIFPLGDLAAINALKQIKLLPISTPRVELQNIVSQWKPFRTAAAMILWHYYLSKRNIDH